MAILITSSRKPCKRTRIFCKQLERALPEAFYVVRGKSSLEEMLELAKREKGKVIHVSDYKGNSGKFVVLDEEGEAKISILLRGVALREEQKEKISLAGEQNLADALCSALELKAGVIKQQGERIFFEHGPAMHVRSFKLGKEARL